MSGKLVLLAGPSGSGKGTLLVHVRATYPHLFYPTSWTTRAPREGEVEGKAQSGKTYRFVTVEEFKKAIDEGMFLEWDHHFNNYYGTPAQEVTAALAAGRVVFHELEVRGVKQLLEKIPREQVKVIFITAGSWDDMARRIRARQEISDEEFETRRVKYEDEMLFASEADYVLVNEDGKLEDTQKKFDESMKEILA